MSKEVTLTGFVVNIVRHDMNERFRFEYSLGESTFIYDFFEKKIDVAEWVLARHYEK